MTAKIGSYGLGRIGRHISRQVLKNDAVEVVAINDLTDAEMLAHLPKYESIHGTLEADVSVEDDDIITTGKRVHVFSEHEPAKIGWKDYGVEVVIESTGRFTNRADASKHLEAGAKKVIISAPAKDDDFTVVMGVNEADYDADNHHIISNASCTTNSLAPLAKVLDEKFGIKRGLMTTVHAYTNDQQILDLP